jgi:glycerol-3-phosphate dehydrogenase
MISVIGGKLTTAASLARECVATIGASVPNPSRTGVSAPHDPVVADMDPMLDEFVRYIAGIGGISESSASGIVEWHGKRSVAIAKMALSSAELRAPLCPHTEHIVAEAMDAVANECAMTLGDILLRRVPVALGACWSHECSREAAVRIKSVMGWSEKQAATELEAFELERTAFLTKAASS